MYSYDTPQVAAPTGTAAELDPAVRRMLLASGVTEDELAQLGTIGWAGLQETPTGEGSDTTFGINPRIRGGLLSVRDEFAPTAGQGTPYSYDTPEGKAIKRIQFSDIDTLNREQAGLGNVNPDFRPTVSLDYDPTTGALMGSDVSMYSQRQKDKEASTGAALAEIAGIVGPMIAGPLGKGLAEFASIPAWAASAGVAGGLSALSGGNPLRSALMAGIGAATDLPVGQVVGAAKMLTAPDSSRRSANPTMSQLYAEYLASKGK